MENPSMRFPSSRISRTRPANALSSSEYTLQYWAPTIGNFLSIICLTLPAGWEWPRLLLCVRADTTSRGLHRWALQGLAAADVRGFGPRCRWCERTFSCSLLCSECGSGLSHSLVQPGTFSWTVYTLWWSHCLLCWKHQQHSFLQFTHGLEDTALELLVPDNKALSSSIASKRYTYLQLH